MSPRVWIPGQAEAGRDVTFQFLFQDPGTYAVWVRAR